MTVITTCKFYYFISFVNPRWSYGTHTSLCTRFTNRILSIWDHRHRAFAFLILLAFKRGSYFAFISMLALPVQTRVLNHWSPRLYNLSIDFHLIIMLLWHFYKIGVPPTALKARTVELTPPGIALFLLQQS
jgi:hypothetical protein